MLSLGGLAFLNPWLLAPLLALPALWLLLRAIPPSPRRAAFPGVRLLLGLDDPERTPDRTPLWLLLLRCAIAAAAILAFAEPVLNPKARLGGAGPVLLAMDGGWASAPDWEARRARALDVLAQAERAERPVIFTALARPAPETQAFEVRPAAEWRGEIEALQPAPWAPQRAAFLARLRAQTPQIGETVWLTDGLDHGEAGEFGAALADVAGLAVIGPDALAPALRAPELVDGALTATVLRAAAGPAESAQVAAYGGDPLRDPGEARKLGEVAVTFEAEAVEAVAAFELPLELRNRVNRVALTARPSAGGAALADDGVRRRRVGLVAGGSQTEAQRLISDLHYLRAALVGVAETVEGDVAAVLDARPDAVFMADVGRFTEAEAEALTAWVEAGGLLVRFAGPRMAGGTEALAGGAGVVDDPLQPVRLRAGGRAMGGAMAWGAPQRVRPFPPESPFAGLAVAEDVAVNRQLLAEIGPELSERTWAALEDGTPLVTARTAGAGRIALFHVTANAEWSTLPLSGLFVEMTRRLTQLSGGGGPRDRAALAGRMARPVALLDGYGRLARADAAAGAPVERLDAAPGPDAPPGLYAVGETLLAFNLFGPEATLTAAPPPPASARMETLEAAQERPLAPWLLAAALALLAADTVAGLILAGRLPAPRRRRAAGGALALALAASLAASLAGAPAAQAQTDEARALHAANATVLAHVRTMDPQVDRIAEAGLRGLSRILAARTAVEPEAPAGVDLETDDLAFYTLLYWPITTAQPTPSDVAMAKLNQFLRTGGMIVFDTRDRHLEFGAGPTQNAAALRRLTARLDLPPLEPVGEDHVLTRAFYLLETFPGRHAGGRVWVEAAPPAAPGEAPPARFSSRNDDVSPVVVGAADWAAAWAVDEAGEFLAPVGGGDGFRQREMAYRFGVNLVMYALTGNYKSDQVHVPALLERLGQ
ncbi:MAG: DUF4159 domain-containing protein [Rubrimonas sp.]|uniref:DUF4159 domain-containing protein n=1 Tax=Rubrimonas sp. TaxID=2036015 RepID=UPI002FDD699B